MGRLRRRDRGAPGPREWGRSPGPPSPRPGIPAQGAPGGPAAAGPTFAHGRPRGLEAVAGVAVALVVAGEVEAEAAVAAHVGLGALVQVCAGRSGAPGERITRDRGGPSGSPSPGLPPPPRPLTHARSAPGSHVQPVAAVAVAVVGAARVHADAPPGAARLRLALVHVWGHRSHPIRGSFREDPASPRGVLPPARTPAGRAHPRSSGAAGATGSPGCSGRNSRAGPARTPRGRRCSGSGDTRRSLRDTGQGPLGEGGRPRPSSSPGLSLRL